MNIEQTANGDLIVSFQDVKTEADRAFAHQVLARWDVAPIMLKASAGLVKVISARKFRGDGAAAIRELTVQIETQITEYGSLMDAPDKTVPDATVNIDLSKLGEYSRHVGAERMADDADPPIGPSE